MTNFKEALNLVLTFLSDNVTFKIKKLITNLHKLNEHMEIFLK